MTGRVAAPGAVAEDPGPVSAGAALPESLLRIVLVLSLWVALGSLVHAIADGLGDEPWRRAGVGIAIVAISAAGALAHAQVAALMRTRPWVVIAIGLGQVALAAIDGLVGGPYVAWSLTCLGLAVVAARAATVWLCVALLATAYSFGVFIAHAPGELADGGRLGGVAGALAAYPVAAIVLMALRGRYLRFASDAGPIIDDIRRGTPGALPGLAAHLSCATRALPPAPVRLTPAERRVVEGLAAGLAPKQLAQQWDVSITTVRTHIRHAKRKTSSATLRDLAALASDPRWPEVCA